MSYSIILNPKIISESKPGIRVFLPTYRRLEQFRWSLRSTLKSGKNVTNESLSLVIVSNHPDSHKQVRNIIKDEIQNTKESSLWQISIIERPETLNPVDNWFNAIKDYSIVGEIVFLHGDDDIYLPNGLATRCLLMRKQNAVIGVSHNGSGLYYLSGDTCSPPSTASPDSSESQLLSMDSTILSCGAFIGNQCYLFGQEFLAALSKANEWCDEQYWLSRTERTLMLPYYLPIAGLLLKYRVLGMQCCGEIRGMDLHECATSPYSCRSWNGQFLYGATYAVLINRDLGNIPELHQERAWYKRHAALGWPTIPDDARISMSSKVAWFTKIFPKLGVDNFYAVKTIPSLLLKWSGMRRKIYMSRMKSMIKEVKTETWLEEMHQNQINMK